MGQLPLESPPFVAAVPNGVSGCTTRMRRQGRCMAVCQDPDRSDKGCLQWIVNSFWRWSVSLI